MWLVSVQQQPRDGFLSCNSRAAVNASNAALPPAGTANMVRACMPPAAPAAAGCRVLVLGGTGHVGRSTALALSELRPDLNIIVGGRNREKGTSLVSKLGGERSEFVQVDIHNASRLKAVMEGVDLVIHAAGPFQRDDKCTVLQAAISSKTAYTDVCDGMDYSWRAKSLHDQAKASGVPALITAGISPGVSNVMAAELVRAAESNNGAPERLRFFYYIAGPTTLGTSFSLLGEDVIAYNKGQEIRLKPYSGAQNIHFGKGIGRKDVYLMNLPEVKSVHRLLNVPTVDARFGTDPFIWNWGMETLANSLPADILRNNNIIMKLTEFVEHAEKEGAIVATQKTSRRRSVQAQSLHVRTGQGSQPPHLHYRLPTLPAARHTRGYRTSRELALSSHPYYTALLVQEKD